jgi:regulation of enolase protein 1 (concanavalin A-like superfamily)
MDGMEWFHEAPRWSVQDRTISVVSAPKTDFWRKTHYSVIHDNGHFYYRRVPSDFVIEVKVIGQYRALYDQAGLMLRVDEQSWMKCGIEFVGGVQQVSAVVTREYSDWSVVPLPQNPSAIWLRVTRRQESVEVQYALDGQHYTLLRLAYLVPAESVSAGLMCASPEGDGFTTTFEDLSVRPLPAGSAQQPGG